jgi:quinol monooxygenase YgiN/predicted ester cyclase
MSTYSDLLDYYVERYNAGDLAAVMDLYADDAVQLMPDGIFKGRDEIEKRLALELNAFTEVRHSVESFLEQDDLFADEFIFRGTHTSTVRLPDGTELPPTGLRVEIRGMELVQMRDSKIIVDNLYYDNVAVLAQLGLLPQPKPARHIELHAQLKIRPGKVEEFKAQAAEIVRLAQQLDTKTLRFDWFISDDGTRCEIHEVYADEAAFFEHGQHIMQARSKLFADTVDVANGGHRVTAFGDVPPRIVEMANAHGNGIERYSFLQGLEPAPAI